MTLAIETVGLGKTFVVRAKSSTGRWRRDRREVSAVERQTASRSRAPVSDDG